MDGLIVVLDVKSSKNIRSWWFFISGKPVDTVASLFFLRGLIHPFGGDRHHQESRQISFDYNLTSSEEKIVWIWGTTGRREFPDASKEFILYWNWNVGTSFYFMTRFFLIQQYDVCSFKSLPEKKSWVVFLSITCRMRYLQKLVI